MSDEELVKQVLDGQKDCFTEIVEKYQRQIFVYILRLLNFHEQDAEDTLGQTFMKCYQNLAGFNNSLKFSSWLYRIAHNEAVNLIRKKSKEYTFELKQTLEIANFDFDKPKKADLEKILTKLKTEDNNILNLFYFQEKSIKEIGEILKISDSNVKVKLNRARNKAKEIIK